MTTVRVRFTPNGTPTPGQISFVLRHDEGNRPIASGRDILNGPGEWVPVPVEGADVEVRPNDPGTHYVVKVRAGNDPQQTETFTIPPNGPINFGDLVRYDPKAGMAYEPDPNWYAHLSAVENGINGVQAELTSAVTTVQGIASTTADSIRGEVSADADRAETSANTATTVKGDLERIFLGGTAAVNDAAVQTFVATEGTATKAALDKKYERGISVREYGATGDGTTDDTDAFNAAISALGSMLASPLSNRFQRRPRLYIPAGLYRITRGLSVVNFNGLIVEGEGPLNSIVLFDSALDEAVFDIGNFSPTPSDVFVGVQDATFRDLRIQRNGSISGSRVGQGIRSNGGGGLITENVAVCGFKYGVNSPYGGDFNSYTNLVAEYCDVGVYQGPGGQQFLMHNPHVFFCGEGIVLDRWAHALIVKPTINSCSIAGIVLEAITHTSTRQLTSFNTLGTMYQSKLVIDTPWFEGHAGGVDEFVPTNFIENRNGGNDAYRDIEIRDPYIVAGQSTVKTTTAFFANVSGFPAQRVSVRRPVLIGNLVRWFTDPGGNSTLDNPRTANGFAAPVASNTASATLRVIEGTSRKAGLLPLVETAENMSGVDGVATSYQVNGVVRFGFKNAGDYLYRMAFDIQNRRLYLDDHSQSTAFSVGRNSAMPASGSYGVGSFVHNTAPVVSEGRLLFGWKRLTTGSGHVAGVDWVPVYMATS